MHKQVIVTVTDEPSYIMHSIIIFVSVYYRSCHTQLSHTHYITVCLCWRLLLMLLRTINNRCMSWMYVGTLCTELYLISIVGRASNGLLMV